jgi:hypothetical protein
MPGFTTTADHRSAVPISSDVNSPDYIVDIPRVHGPGERAEEGSLRGRPWLAVHWRCCSIYSRIYRDRAGLTYRGRCPGCARPLNIQVGPGGTRCRFFEAT